MEELLKALGFTVTEENKSKVEAAKKILGEKFVAKHRFDEKSEELKKATETIKERDNQLSEFKKFEGDKAALEQKVKELQEANKKASEDYNKSLTLEKTKNAIKRELLGKVHDESLAVALLDLSKVEVGEDGNVKNGLKEQLEKLKTDKPFLFKQEQSAPAKNNHFKPAGNPPADGSDGNPDGAVAFAKSLAQGVKNTQSTSETGAKAYFGEGK